MRGARALLATIVAATLLAGCATAPASPTGSAAPLPVELQVYAAASLGRALKALAPVYVASHPGVRLVLSFDSSAALATKIEQGAPADLLLAADTATPQRLVDSGLGAGAVRPFARTRLVVIVPAMGRTRVAAPADLGREGVRVIACADGVPLARYTARWLERVAALPAYGDDFPARYAANVVSREENAAALVAKVMLGEGDGAIVYASEVAGNLAVRPVAIPDDENVEATYGGLALAGAAHPTEAAAFLAWLAGEEGSATLAAYGFDPPR